MASDRWYRSCRALNVASAFLIVGSLVVTGTGTASARGLPLVRAYPFRAPSKSAPRPALDRHSVLVRFRSGVDASSERAILEREGASLLGAVGATGYVQAATGSSSPGAVLKSLRRDPRVADAVPNYLRHAAAVPNDTFYHQYQAPYLSSIRMPQAWDVTQGSATYKVAVLDTGVDLNHPDLAARINPGYDFINNDTLAWDDDPYSHGTMVAGIAAGITNNAKGIAGAAWTAGIIPVKVLDKDGIGTDVEVASGITWAADHGASVINLSLGGYGDSPVLASAVSYALGKGAVVVGAAGNDAVSEPFYPAAYPGVIAVSGTDDSAGTFAWFSNYGWWVGVSAPNFNITSTFKASGTHEAYGVGSGTSFAAPIVSGIAVLVRVKNPSFTPAQVVARIESTAKDLGPKGIDPYYGWGRVDGDSAVTGVKAAAGTFPPRDALEPNGTLDSASNLTTSATSTISPEGDGDWFKKSVSAPGSVTFTVTPPAYNPNVLRAKEMDPVLDVYGPDLRLLAHQDTGFEGQTESVTVPALTSGNYYARVLNYMGSQSPGAYSVAVTTSVDPAQLRFGAPTPVVGGWIRGKTADVTGDGIADFIAPISGSIDVYPGQPDGSLGDPVAYAIDGTFVEMATAPLNSDAVPDVAVVTNQGIDVFEAQGGALVKTQFFAVTNGFRWIRIADINRDGLGDLLAFEGIDTWLYTNTGSGFTSSIVDTNFLDWGEVLDVNGDGMPDVAGLRGYQPGGGFTVLLQQPGGTFTTTNYPYSGTFSGFGAADLNGDGRPDLVASVINSSAADLVFLTQQSDGGFVMTTTLVGPHQVFDLRAVDMNGDGRADLAFSHRAKLEFAVKLQRPAGTLTPESVYPVPDTLNLIEFGLADPSLDGSPDAVIYRQRPDSGVDTVLMTQVAPGSGLPVWVRGTSPGDFAAGIARNVSPTVTFGRNLDPASITSTAVWLRNGLAGNSASVTLSYSAASKTITIDPTPPTISPNTPYIVYVSGVKDTDGNVMPAFTFRLTTGAT